MFSALLKILLLLIVFVGLVVVAGVSGFSFIVWPTSIADHQIAITPKMLADLESLKAERKFDLDRANFYPGAPKEAVRIAAQTVVNKAIEDLIVGLPRAPRRATVLGILKSNLRGMDRFDSEEKDQALHYFERLLSTVGIEGSGQLFNVWRYGFPYGWLIR